MDNDTANPTIEEQLQEKFLALPKAIQQAITSADVEKRLRELSDTYKLHLDQWQKLENEVMLTLLGFQDADRLEESVKKEVGVPDDVAGALTNDIATMIFQPIRKELERELEQAQSNRQEAIGEVGNAQMVAETPAEPPAEQKLLVAPSTPPPPPPEGKVVRAPVSSSYAPKTPSHERKTVEGDPYREAVS